jgi:esterase/lipase
MSFKNISTSTKTINFIFYFLLLDQKKQKSRRKAISIFSSHKNLRSTTRKICISLLFAKTSRTLTNVCVGLYNSISLKASTNKNIILVIILVFSCFSNLKSQTAIQQSQAIYDYLKTNHLEKIDALFDTLGMGKLIKAMQTDAYKKELAILGKPKKLLAIYDEDAGCKKRTAIAIEFKKEKKLVTILFNQQHRIENLKMMPYTETPFHILKGYKGFSEVTDLTTEVKTRDGLTLGANIAFGDTSKQKSPLVILVQGSGPSDRDETIGPNKIFRDLAQGLAQQGVVSLRYDKRTYAYSNNLTVLNDSLTLYEETINDAIDAVNIARQFTFIDTTQIYIIGHSQGAMCAPKMAELCPKLKGIIMMAAPSKNLVDIIPEQVEYLANLDDSISNQEQMQINSVKWMVEKIKSPTLSNKTPKTMLMGASAKYWKSVLNYNQVETAKKLTLPIFILNGERDYQVRMIEFDTWHEELNKHKNVTYQYYQKLNHLFLEGEGTPNANEYYIPGHIPQYVIDDLVKFILKK